MSFDMRAKSSLLPVALIVLAVAILGAALIVTDAINHSSAAQITAQEASEQKTRAAIYSTAAQASTDAMQRDVAARLQAQHQANMQRLLNQP